MSPTPARPAPQVIQRPTAPPLRITTTTTLPAASQAKPYSHTLTLSGGEGLYQWSVIGRRLPAGLTLSNAGLLSGTPTESGRFSFRVRVTDSAAGKPRAATREFALVVGALAVSPPKGTTPSGAVVTTGPTVAKTVIVAPLTATGFTPAQPIVPKTVAVTPLTASGFTPSQPIVAKSIVVAPLTVTGFTPAQPIVPKTVIVVPLTATGF